MLRISKSVYAVGGVIVAAGLIAFTNPKTVHAVAAALVQVTNTSSNPVITQGIGQQAAEIVEIRCGITSTSCHQIFPNSSLDGTAFVVPDDQSMVITSADVSVVVFTLGQQVPCGGFSEVDLNSTAGTREIWYVAASSGTQHFTYPSGLVFASGSPLTGAVTTVGAECGFQVELHGYLTTS